ncbi:TPA: InlB B-repeat-containing protein [Enterococcus faecalis]|nr:InlB B-repeat-containing protein [Enterococcus faecalis]
MQVEVKKFGMIQNILSIIGSDAQLREYHDNNNTGNNYYTREIAELSFETNDGTSIKEQKVISEKQKWSVPDNFRKENFIFFGWYRDIELTEAFDFSEISSGNKTVYVKWKGIYEVEIPTKLNLNESNELTIKGINRGTEKSLKITTNDTMDLENSYDNSIIYEVILEWDEKKENKDLLVVNPKIEDEKYNEKFSLLEFNFTNNMRAGKYNGTVNFSIMYE